MESREERIIKIVGENKKVEVGELSNLLKVSKVTIRKDLDRLENRGILHREHGFAQLNSEADIGYRLAMNYEVKTKIAKRAAESVKDGETVMIESGSTCALLAEELAFSHKNITIITNSNFIASYIRKSETVKIILLGGEYQKDSQVNVGPLVKRIAENFYVNKLFIGVDGFDEKRGFMGADIARVDTVKVLTEYAEKVVVLTESSKFQEKGGVFQLRFDDVSMVYTDNLLEDRARRFLEHREIQLIMV